MRIVPMTIVRRGELFDQYSDNVIQYRESKFHNAMIDVDCTINFVKGFCTVKDLMIETSGTLAYYAEVLPRLALDRYIEISNPPGTLDELYRAPEDAPVNPPVTCPLVTSAKTAQLVKAAKEALKELTRLDNDGSALARMMLKDALTSMGEL